MNFSCEGVKKVLQTPAHVSGLKPTWTIVGNRGAETIRMEKMVSLFLYKEGDPIKIPSAWILAC